MHVKKLITKEPQCFYKIITIYNVCSDDRGWTPIHLASKNGHLEALQLLVLHAQQRHIEIVDEQHVSQSCEAYIYTLCFTPKYEALCKVFVHPEDCSLPCLC